MSDQSSGVSAKMPAVSRPNEIVANTRRPRMYIKTIDAVRANNGSADTVRLQIRLA